MKQTILFFALALFLFSCGGKSEQSTSEGTNVITQKAAVPPVTDDLANHPGERLYKQHCLVCHQADGNGVPGMFPPLHDTKWVNGDNETLISIVLHGMDEEIEVDGEIYNTIMAPLPHLSDQEVAHVLNYVRKRFGSASPDITVEQVAGVRAGG